MLLIFRARDFSNKCPMCRIPYHMCADQFRVNTLVDGLVKKYFPGPHTQRADEDMMACIGLCRRCRLLSRALGLTAHMHGQPTIGC